MRTIDPARHAERRLFILEAAERCFVRHGLKAATITHICGEARISPGHLYHYFDSKDAIMIALCEAILHHAAERVKQVSRSSNILDALLSAIGNASHGTTHWGQSLMFDMLAEARRDPALAQIVRGYHRSVARLVAGLVRDAQSRQQIDPGLDADACAAILIGVVDASEVVAIRDPELAQKRRLAAIRTMVKRFLAPPPDVPVAKAR